MNTKKVLFALAFVAAFIFVSCSPNSTSDEDSLYNGETGGIEKKSVRDSDIS